MTEITNAIRLICDEKNLSYELVKETVEFALSAAYRKDYGQKNQNIKVEFDLETGKSKIFDIKKIVEDVPVIPEEEENNEEIEEEKPSVLVIHGIGGDETQNWFPWLKNILEEKKCSIFIPSLPDANKPELEKWLDSLAELKEKLSDKVVVIAHSLGCPIACQFIIKEKLKIKNLILVAPTGKSMNEDNFLELEKVGLDEEEVESIKKINKNKINFTSLKKLVDNTIIYLSSDDPFVPLQIQDDYKKLKPEVKILENKGHFTTLAGNLVEFPEILDDASLEEKKFNPKFEIQISDAKIINKNIKIGDEMKTKLETPSDYGRMAAQTAKQVIIQRLREAEREVIFADFHEKEGEVINGIIQRQENKFVLIDIGKAVGRLPQEEQIYGEQYKTGDRIKVYVKEVIKGQRGIEIILSRTSEEILKKIFLLEIPEIANELIELKAVAREAGSRSKVAVWTELDNIDPVGSCVGQRGSRIQTIINEIGGEKIDIIKYDENPSIFISNALAPAKIISIDIREREQKAIVMVGKNQLSLAIGKGGQNARLASALTKWRIDIRETQEVESDIETDEKNNKEVEKVEEEKEDVKDKKVKTKKEEVKKEEVVEVKEKNKADVKDKKVKTKKEETKKVKVKKEKTEKVKTKKVEIKDKKTKIKK